MKKLFILCLLLFCLSGCYSEINSSIFISSIGFDVENNSVVGYFVANPNANLARSGESSKELDYVKCKGNSIEEIFNEAKKSVLCYVNFMHLKTVIFQERFLQSKYVCEYLEYMQETQDVTFNYYVFTTKDDIKKVYQFENPDSISFQFSLLSSPDLLHYRDFGTTKLHFLDFANNYCNPKRYLHVPILEAKEEWNNKTTISIAGFLNYKGNQNDYLLETYPGMIFLYDHDMFLYTYQGVTYKLMNYSVYPQIVDNVYTLQIRLKAETITNKKGGLDIKTIIYESLQNFLDSYIQNQGSLYLIDFYNYTNKKALNALLYKINIEE